MLNTFLFQSNQTYNQIGVLRNEGFCRGPGPREIAFTFIFVTPQNTDFLVIALFGFVKLFSAEDAPFTSSGRGVKCLHIILLLG